jgi:hypothetical protein
MTEAQNNGAAVPLELCPHTKFRVKKEALPTLSHKRPSLQISGFYTGKSQQKIKG